MNWYRVSIDISKITEIATKTRNLILTDEKQTLRDKCLPVSRHLARLLINHGFRNSIVNRGLFKTDKPCMSIEIDPDYYFNDKALMEEARCNILHYWVEVNSSIIVDITADQFNDELNSPFDKVFVSPKSSSERHTVITEDYIDPKIIFPNATF